MIARAVLLSVLMSAGASAQDSGVELRPVDRATVRIIAVQGMVQARGPAGEMVVGLRAAHGSGVLVGDGFVATASHVVEGADYLVVVLPGQDVGMPGRVVHRSAAHDLAVLRVGGATPRPLAIATRQRLELGQTVHVSGYPLDARETWPAAVSGQIGRPLNDGRVQLSISVNPGNSGGPVITTDGALVGIVSQGADPQAGAQGIAIMEPIARLAEPLAALARGAAEAPPPRSLASELVLEELTARPPPALDARVARLRDAALDEPMAAVLLAMEAIDVSRALLARAGVREPAQLDEAARAQHAEVMESARSWAVRVSADAGLASRYGALQTLTTSPAPVAMGGLVGATSGSATSGPSASPAITGPATGPSPFAPPVTHEEEYPSMFSAGVTVWGGLHFDDARNADVVGGGEGGAGATLRMSFVNSPYYRVPLLLGLDVGVGAWRERVAFSVLGVVGLRMEVGPRDAHGFVEMSYTPGFATAEGRDDGVARAYRAGVGASFAGWEITITWREIGRWANDTLRTLTLGVGAEVDL